MINILYIADPGSIHDQKWIKWFEERDNYQPHVLVRKSHQKNENPASLNIAGYIDDYSLFKPWKNKTGKKLVKELIKNKKIDIVHIFYAEPNILWASAIEPITPVILTTRGSDVLIGMKRIVENQNAKSKWMLKKYQANFSRCVSIVSTSQKQISYLKEHFQLKVNQQIIRTGVDIGFKKEVEQKENIMFFPRNMTPLYQHELALKAISMLPEKIRNSWKFVFTNKESQYTEYVDLIKTEIEKLKNINVDFHKSLEPKEYFELMGKAKIVVMTPKSDGSPVSGMEAIFMNCKLVMPDLDYDEELYEGAFKYEQNNQESLVSFIKEAINKEMPKVSLQYKKLIDRNQQMLKLHDIYQSLLSQRK